MSLFQKYLIFKRRLSGILSDELQEAKEASFIELSLLLEKRVKRSLRPPELVAVWSLDDKQTEVLTNLLEEARTHETTRNP